MLFRVPYRKAANQRRVSVMAIKNRRNFFSIAAALLLGSRARAQAPARGGAKELARHPLSGPQEGMEAILVEVIARPGVPSTAHRHPGFVLGYVLEGEMSFGINAMKPNTVKAGSTFFEPIGALHTAGTSANPDAPVRFLAFIVAPKGSPVTLPA
jgi:quercetin dioxygenase-like cupin family protein